MQTSKSILAAACRKHNHSFCDNQEQLVFWYAIKNMVKFNVISFLLSNFRGKLKSWTSIEGEGYQTEQNKRRYSLYITFLFYCIFSQ